MSSESGGGLSQWSVTLNIFLCLSVAGRSGLVLRCVLTSTGGFGTRLGWVGPLLLSEVVIVRNVDLGGP